MSEPIGSERIFSLDLNSASNLFKIKYEKLSENVYNSANVLLGRVKKSYDFVGEKIQITIPSSFSGGVGSGSLPKANTAKYVRAELTAKKMYAVVEIDRETIKAALKDEGSFVRATKEVVKKAVESFMRNMSRVLFSDGSGLLAQGNGTAVTGAGSEADPFILSVTGMKESDVEERDLVELETAAGVSQGMFEIVDVIVDNGTTAQVTLSDGVTTADRAVSEVHLKLALSNTASSIDADSKVFMQGSGSALESDPEGLKGILKTKADLKAVNKEPYGIEPARRWEVAHHEKALNASISTDMLNKAMLKIKKKCGKSPNLIVCSYTQYEKILNLLEDQKRFTVATRAGLKSKSGADISFSGVEFMSVDGPVGIFPERFIEDDRIYLLNDSHIHIKHRPDFGWFDDDGTVFLRKYDADAYEARYGGYLQIYINPCFHGVIDELAV